MTLWLPLAWTRYLLAPYAAVSLVTAVGLARLPFDLWTVARSLRPATPASFFASRGGIAAAVIATAVVWLGLTSTSWVIAPELLSPDAPTVNDSREQRERHRAALRRATGDSIVLTHNRATLLAREQRFAEAAALLELVVDRAAREEGNATARDVRRSVALAELARLRMATGDRVGAEQALRLRVEAVRALRDGMRSTDPEVRSSYDELIAGDERKIRESYEGP
jgi:hypothetical protein